MNDKLDLLFYFSFEKNNFMNQKIQIYDFIIPKPQT